MTTPKQPTLTAIPYALQSTGPYNLPKRAPREDTRAREIAEALRRRIKTNETTKGRNNGNS